MRPLISGDFANRAQLVDFVMTVRFLTGKSLAIIAKQAGVSEVTALEIQRGPEGKEWTVRYFNFLEQFEQELKTNGKDITQETSRNASWNQRASFDITKVAVRERGTAEP